VAELLCIPAAECAERAGQLVATALASALRDKPYARLAIPGGSAVTALPFVRQALGAQWAQVHLTWVDERCVDFDHADSNRGQAYRSGALRKEEEPGYTLPLWLDGESAESAQERVASALEEHFAGALDVSLLGMGPDGHIASLFPGHALLTLPALRTVAFLDDSPKPPSARMTLTQSFLARSGTSILLAVGQEKESALRRVLASDAALPASHLPNLQIITNLDIGAVA
jgi:6-phosphogluconolactonase